MKNKKYIFIIIISVLLLIITLSLVFYYNSVNKELLNVNEEENKIETQNAIMNAEFENEEETNETKNEISGISDNTENIIDTTEKKESTSVSISTKSNGNTKEQKSTQAEVNNDKKSKNSDNTNTDSSTTTKTWTTNLTYGGEIYDKDGPTGSYWMQGEELDFNGIDMSDWTIK